MGTGLSRPAAAATAAGGDAPPHSPLGGTPADDESIFAAAAAAAPLTAAWNQEPWAVTVLDNARQFAVQLVCAGGSGAIAKTAVAPLERAKILAQVQAMAVAGPPEQRYRGPWDALWRMRTAEGGWRVWYRGNGANVIRLVPEVGFKFAAHDQFRVMFSPPDGSPMGVQEKMAAGAATGVCKTLLFYPLDFCRTRITAHTTFVGAAPHLQPLAAAAAAAAAAKSAAGGPAAAAAAAAQARRQVWTAAAAAAGRRAPGDVQQQQQRRGPSCGATAVVTRTLVSSSITSNSSSGISTSTTTSGSNSSSSRIHSSSSSTLSRSSLAQAHRWLHQGATAAVEAPRPPPLPPAPSPAAAVPGVLGTLSSAIAREGLLAPYKGMSLSLPGVVVYTSVSFTAYDTFKHQLPQDKNSRETWWYPFAKMGCGAAAGVAAQTCSYPLDTLRRRMQVSGAPWTAAGATAAAATAAAQAAAGPTAAGASHSSTRTRPARVSYGAMLRSMATRGSGDSGLLRSLFRGWTVNCVKIIPGAAVQFVAYDALRVGVTWLDVTSGAQSPL